MDDPSAPDLDRRYRPLIVAELDDLRGASAATAQERRPVELDQQSVGRLSRMDAIRNLEMAAGTEARRKARIVALTRALARLDEGEFGSCEDCGDFIGHGRLDADPAAPRCVECAG